MNIYLIAKLVHIVGALGFFMALGLELSSLWHARHAATSEQVQERLHISRSAQRLGPLSMLLILISGIYMMATVWGGVAWVIIALGALILMVVLGLAMTAPRRTAIERALSTEKGPVSSSLHDLLHDSRLWLSIRLRASIALGIVILMTVKPDLVGSLITVTVAFVLGVVFNLPARGRERCLKAGANEYMSKPVCLKQLAFDAVSRLGLRMQRTNKALARPARCLAGDSMIRICLNSRYRDSSS